MKTLENNSKETKKLKLIGFHQTKRSLWNSYRRFSYFNSLQRKCNENTVYFGSCI
ncbi:MAG: hypothetical protein KGZ87_01875 [Bacteroidetes bacterium]|nr:hypothetical protein [Bacteroidota bacterium]